MTVPGDRASTTPVRGYRERIADRRALLTGLRTVAGTGRAVIVTDTDHLLDIDATVGQFSEIEVTVFAPAVDRSSRIRPPNLRVVAGVHPTRLHLFLSAHGPVDLFVDATNGSLRRAYLHRLLGHLRPGGSYVLAGSADDGPVVDDPRVSGLVGRVEVTPDCVVLVRSGPVAVKLRHTEVEYVVRRSGGPVWSTVVRREPATRVSTKDVIGTHNDPQLRGKLYPDVLEVPELLVRRYAEVAAHPYGVLRKDRYVLPDSFRMWLAPRPKNRRLEAPSPYFAGSATVPEARLAGEYYYLDLEYSMHFGHFMTEALGRLWAWPEAKAENPDLKLLMGRLLPFQADLIEAYGIDRDDIVVVNTPTRIESVLAAMPGFHIGTYASPVLSETYARIRSGMPEVDGPRDEKVFLLREPGLWRECTNAAELEGFCADRGFALRRPLDYTLAQQAGMFRHARVVASYIGSQLYGQLFGGPLQIVAFTGRTYTSTNEFLLAGVNGQTLHQFWSDDAPGNRDVDVQGRPLGRMNQDYTFDFAADGPALDRLLQRLV